MFEDSLAAIVQHRQGDPETAIRILGSRNRLEEIDGRSAGKSGNLRRDVRKATSLRGGFVNFHKAVQTMQDGADSIH